MRVSTLEKAVDAARMNSIGVKVLMASTRMPQRSLNLISL